jgi:hypothetical protein
VLVKTLRSALLIAGVAISFGASAHAGITSVVSGNGAVGSQDGAVSFLLGPPTGTFTPTFNNAANYTPAQVVTPNPNWVSNAAYDAATGTAAKWDSTAQNVPSSSGNSAVYAIALGGAGGLGSSLAAILTGSFASDDFLTSIWLNGNLIYSYNPPTGAVGMFLAPNSLGTISISSAFINATSQNYLYLEDDNDPATGGPAGLIFNLSVTTTTVPEPSSIAMVGIAGLMGVGAYVRRKRSIA